MSYFDTHAYIDVVRADTNNGLVAYSSGCAIAVARVCTSYFDTHAYIDVVCVDTNNGLRTAANNM
ncbi:hypothetical protein [Rhodoflexus sp.]